MTRMLAAMLVAFSSAACGPSRAKVDAERAALAAAVDQVVLTVRESHACDDAEAEHNRAFKVYLASSGESVDARNNEEAAQQKLKVCRALLPSYQERGANLTQAWDAWMDACLSCATGRACFDAERERRKHFAAHGTDVAAEIAATEAMKSATVCSAPKVATAGLAGAK